MRLRKNRRFIILLISFLTLTTLKAQTLYWVGGSGNFNDPAHWSLSSGGASANKIPNSTTEVVFDDASGTGLSVITFPSQLSIGSLKAVNAINSFDFISPARSSLFLSGGINFLSTLNQFNFSGDVYFNSTSAKRNVVNFGSRKINANLFFKEGDFIISSIRLDKNKTISFENGKYNLKYAGLFADKLIIKGSNTKFKIDTASFYITKSVLISDGPTFDSHNFGFLAPFHDSSNVVIDPSVSFGNHSKLSNSSINSVGDASLYALTSCSGSCSATFSLVIDPANTGTFDVVVNNSQCPSTAASISTTGLLPGSSFVVNNVCFCPSANFGVNVYDPNTFVFLNVQILVGSTGTGNFNFIPPSLAITPLISLQPSCNLFCNGGMTLSISGGASPYTVTVVGPSTSSTIVTSNVIALNNLCKGTYTFNAVDVNGCALSPAFLRTLSAPSVLAANPITTSITCNSLCNGSFSVNPNNTGTSGYTVSFSNGFSVTSTGSTAVGISGLCIGPVSATITDVKGCTVTTSSIITQPSSSLSVSSTQTSVTCNGACNGIASATASGGTPPYQYSWAPATGTNPIRSNLCAGTESLTVTDANGCQNASQIFNIAQPPPIVLITTQTDVVCSGSCTGVASVAASGGQNSFLYTWVGPLSTNTISAGTSNSVTNLCAGVYTVFVRDVPNNCQAVTTVTITQPPTLTVSLVSQSITCFGAANGAATVTPSGGNSSSYTYSWTPGAFNTPVITNLGPGGYTVTVFDASLCPITKSVNILTPTGVSPNVTFSVLTCNAANATCDGRINASPTGGTGAYSYTLASSTATIFTAPPYGNLCAGIYSLTLKDGSNCYQTVTVNITQPGVLLPTISTTSVLCFNGTTGGVTGNTGNGGTGPYTTYWTTPTGTASANPLNNQAAGVYIFHVVDSKTCTAQATATITQPSSITVAVSSSSISCFSVCNGVLNSTVTGGVPSPGYSYTWTNASSSVVSTAASATGLCPGLYTLTVQDGNSCIKAAATSVLSPAQITSTVVTNPVACFGDSNGSASVTVAGGTPSFTFSFNSAPTVTNTTGILTGQPTGTYIVTVTDNNNCLHTKTLSIASPTALAATLTGTGSCNVCSGTATILPSFGTGTYAVTWASSLGGSFPATPTLSSLCPGTYTATVTDAKGCVITRSITLNQIITVTVTLGGSSILCNGALTGSAVAQAGGGIGNYSYSWTPTSPAQTSSVLTGVGAGTYIVKVTDQSVPSTCSHTASIVLTQPPAMTITATQTNVTCYSYTNGAIAANVTGGTPGSSPPYTYTWSPSVINTGTNTLSGIASGVYTLNVRDANLCTATSVFTVTQPSSITVNYTKVNPSGCTSTFANGSIQVTPLPSASYQYTLNPGPVTNGTGAFTGLGGGAYSITVMNASGCLNSTVVTLSPPSAPSIAITTTAVACYGYSTGIVSASATGSTAAFTFSWTPAVPNTTTAATTKAINLPAGVYVVTATDGNGCVASQAATVTQASAYTVNPVVSSLRCYNVPTGSIIVAPSGGSPGYTYSWAPTSSVTGQGTATVTALAAGVYTLNLSDTHSCVTPYTFTVTQPPSIVLTGTTTNLLCYTVCAGAITASASGGAGFINYSWAPAAGGSSVITNLCANSGTTPIIYTVTATDANTCSATQTFVLTQPTALTNSINVLSATCSNSCNAIASQTASGGASGYVYTWSSSTLTAASLGSLCSGVYTAYVTDANNCVTSKQFTVTPPAPLSVTLTPFNPLCNAACNGSISTVVSGAQGTVTYSWSPAGSGQNPTGLCATFTPSPVYTLVATDANLCRVTAVVTLTNPPALLANVNSAIPLCHNGTNGSATVSLVNAVGSANYTWIPTGPPTKTTQVVTGLASGPYTVLAMDANSCTASQTFTLANPPALVVNAIVVPATCSQSNGAITANPSGGTPGSPAYTFSWTGIASSASVVTGLAAGPYTVSVADGLACTTTVNILLSNSNGPSAIPVFGTSLTCNSKCTGAASVDVTGIVGGTPPYTSTWIVPVSTVNVLTGLCAGSYTARVEDATGCIGFTDVVIAEPPPIVNTPTISLPLCPGICNGSITIGTTGGNTPYTYSWIGATSSTSVVTNLCAGDYTVVVGYNSVCTDTTRLNIPDQSSITITPRVTNVLCFGGNTGSIDLLISGGTAPYAAGWNSGFTGFPLSNLTAGTYTAIVTDNNGCSNTATATVMEGAQIISATAISSPSCGICNGTASISASGGTAPFTYNWSTSATTPTVGNLCAGIYQVVVTDNLACSKTETLIINNSNGITGENVNLQQIPCSGSCVGAATVSAIGGTSPISYSWINPVSTSSVISNLCPGTYFVQMSDAQSCIRIASVTINPQITLTVSPFVYLPFCTQSNGSISLVISGGTPSYNIVWNPPAGVTTSLSSLNAGVYSYTVIESGPNACSISNTINLSNSNGPVIQATQSNINCFNACTGSISATATGTNTPLTFLWSNASTSPTVTNLCKGLITLTVTDFGGCKAIQSFTLTDNPALQLGITNIHNSTCYGDCNGSINLVPNGGIAPYTYSWTLANANVNPIISLCDGVYTGTVTDSKGCEVSTPAYTIQSASALSITASTYSSSCSSVPDGSISVFLAGGVAEYTYKWSGPSSFTSATQNLTNIYAGTYTVNVLDNLGCSKDSVFSVVPSLTVVANAGDDKIICPSTGTVLLQASSTSGSSTFKWYDAKDIQKKNVLATGDTYLVKNIEEGVSFVLVATSSVASCYSEDAVAVNVFNLPPVDAGKDHLIPIYSTVTIGGHPSSFSAVSLTWTPAIYLDDATISNPEASNTVNVTYTLTVTDANGCIASDTVQVLLYPKLNITSGFTPNGDGKNDTWIIDYIDQFPATTVDIFNRWGDSVFSSTGYDTPFDGKYKGAELPVGTYYYVIKLNHPGYPKPITGPLTIFR